MTFDSTSHREPLRQSVHRQYHAVPPPHHVVIPRNESSLPFLSPLAHSFIPTKLYFIPTRLPFTSSHSPPSQTVEEDSLLHPTSDGSDYIRTGFRNPWSSWHKPHAEEYWHGLHWGKSDNFEPGSESSRQAEDQERGDKAEHDSIPFDVSPNIQARSTTGDQADDLQIVEPDFGLVEKGVVQATWLDHASVLLQLPAPHGTSDGNPIRVLFDPIFSMQ